MKTRPRPNRRDDRRRQVRRDRAFASSFASLEVRSMLSAVLTSSGTVASNAAFVGPLPEPSSPGSSTLASGNRFFAHLQDGATRPPPPPGYATSPMDDGDGEGQGGPHGMGRVEFDNASINIDGTPTREFAFANQGTGKVTVLVGQQCYTVSGIAQPKAVALRDINGDGVPDLIIADSGNDRILVFPGLANGTFGPEADDGSGFAVGAEPSGITVGDVNGDGLPDLIIANSGSDDVSILTGQIQDGKWTLGAQQVVGPGPQAPPSTGPQPSPVMTALADLNGDGRTDLLVLEGGVDAVDVYQGQGDGLFGPEPDQVFPVGADPSDMFVGHFDHRQGLDLVTVNSGSNNISFVSGLDGDDPSTLTITSGGTRPDAAFAVDVNHDGTSDLVVANGGDGRVALLQPGNVGLQLAGVISRADLPSPTAIAPGTETSDGLDLYAATAGQDAAEILHFDLGAASNFLAVPLAGLAPVSESDAELAVQLLSTGESPTDLAAILVNGDDIASDSEHGPASKSALFTKTEGQGLDEELPNQVATTSASSTEVTPPATPAPEDPASWARFVLGLDDALSAPGPALDLVAESDAIEMRGDRPSEALARSRPLETLPNAEAEAFDAALQALWSDADSDAPNTTPGPEAPAIPALPTGATLAPEPPEIPTGDAHSEVVPLISGVIFASRLILKATPPRPPTIRRRDCRRTNPPPQ